MNVLITGTSSGIGFDLARIFSKDSNNNVFAVSRNSINLEKLKSACLESNEDAQIFIFPLDLNEVSNYALLLNKIKAKVDRLDLLINNAGHILNKPFESITYEEVEQTFKVNVIAPFLLSQSALPLLKAAKKPQIINIGSMGGVNGTAKFPGLSAYSSSKGALSILSECLAEELKGYGIRVNCLALGAVNTAMLKSAFPGFNAAHESFEMAEYIANFALHSAQYFNGKTIQVSSTTP